MSGLLSKANAAEGNVENEVKAETVAEVLPAVQEGGGPDVPTMLKTGGWVIIIIGGLLSLQGGSWGTCGCPCCSGPWNWCSLWGASSFGRRR